MVKSLGESATQFSIVVRQRPGVHTVTTPPFGSFFLAKPESFPETVSGDPWGDQARVLDLPGGPYRISGLSERQSEFMDREYGRVIPMVAATDEGTFSTTLYRLPTSYFREIDIDGWDYTFDLGSAPEQLRIAALQFAALVPWSKPGSPAGLWTSVEDEWFQGVIENYLRAVVAHRLLFGDGMLLHSAAAVIGDTASVFVGASGAGKSTIARKAFDAGAPVLSDDLNAVVGLSGTAEVAQLPFTGDMRDQSTLNRAVPLRSIMVLEKGDRVHCTGLSRGEAVAALVATAPFINCGDHNLEILVEKAVALTGRVPVARLTSTRACPFDEIERAIRRFHESA